MQGTYKVQVSVFVLVTTLVNVDPVWYGGGTDAVALIMGLLAEIVTVEELGWGCVQVPVG